ncbi:MAG: hypothetical protein LQ341_003628 [Variospora aurantia]|nr:MAG: hypothetical protein LQ341_003628 [Variospora aurantia]
MLLPRPHTAIAAIAAGLNLTANTTDSNNGLPFPAVCYDRRYATNVPEFSDCAGIIANTIATGPNPSSVRIPFSRRPLPGIHYRTPKYWVSRRGSCRVAIDVPMAPAEMASLQEIKATADAILMNSQCLDKRVSLALNVTRVSTQIQSRLANYDPLGTSTPTFSSSLPYRPYATNAVSRPKAHTGRTTSAPRKKAETAQATTSDAAATTKKPPTKKPAAKKSAAKKPKTSPKKKSKPRTRAKSTRARKKPTKAKKRRLTPKQKEEQAKQKGRQTLKDLKEKALTIPKKLPATAYSVLLLEQMKARRAGGKRDPTRVITKDCGTMYHSLSPEQREHYNHIANQNRATNKRQYGEWIRSFTPIQIRQANTARVQLKKKTKASWPKLWDERQVKRFRNTYNFFLTARHKSGDFAGVPFVEASKLIGREWKALSADEKKAYLQSAEEDLARYDQEVKAVYNRDVVRPAAKAA